MEGLKKRPAKGAGIGKHAGGVGRVSQKKKGKGFRIAAGEKGVHDVSSTEKTL